MKKSRMGLSLLILVLVLSLPALLAACGGDEETTTTAGQDTVTTAAPPAAETLKVGAVLQLTDWYSALDLAEKTDAEIVAKIVNEEDPLVIQGKTYNIELVIQDGKSNLDGNTAAATKLCLDDKVKFVVGPSAFFNQGTSATFEQNKVIHVAGYNTFTPGELGADTPYGFLGSLDPIAQNTAMLTALKQEYPEVKSVVLAANDEAATEYLLPEILAAAERLGLTIAGDPVLFNTNADDFSPIATKINSIEGADAYWIATGSPPGYCGIARGLRTLNNDKPIVFSGHAPATVELVGPDLATDIINLYTCMYGGEFNAPMVDKVFEGGDTTRQWYGMASNALWMLVDVMRTADSVDPDVVKTTWESMDTISTLYGDGTLCGTETYGLPNRSVVFPAPVVKIVDGEIINLPWVTPEPTP